MKLRKLLDQGQAKSRALVASTRGISLLSMPTPVSLTSSVREPDLPRAVRTVIVPPDGVNLIAFDRRLRTICLIARGSPSSAGSFSPFSM